MDGCLCQRPIHSLAWPLNPGVVGRSQAVLNLWQARSKGWRRQIAVGPERFLGRSAIVGENHVDLVGDRSPARARSQVTPKPRGAATVF
jgi:hypothetical protein